MNRQRPLKVLMLASSYPRSDVDTAAVFLRSLAGKLSERGNHIRVLVPADGRSETKIEGNVTVHRFQYFPVALQKLAYGSGILPNLKQKPWLWIQVPFFMIAMTCSLLRLIRWERPDLIHAHWILPQGLIAVLAKFFSKVVVIASAHGGDAFALHGGLSRRLKRFTVSHSDAWTTNTLASAKAIDRTDLLPKPHIIPMGVDIELFSMGDPTTLRRKLPADRRVVLFVGRLVEKKGCYYLLDAFSRLPSTVRAQTSLWIIGDGEERSQLEQYANTLGLSGNIRFWGVIRNDLLPDFYAAADLFVAPSIEAESGDTEGQGVVFLEAFAAQTCVLATRVGGIGEVVADGITGVLVEPRNPNGLASAIEKLLRDEALRRRLAANALASVKQRYDWKHIGEEFEKLYREVCRSQEPS